MPDKPTDNTDDNLKDNLTIWDQLKEVPTKAQKPILGGRLKGMTDISPMWRYHQMTSIFGPIGIGWKFTLDRQWIDTGANEEQCAHTNISLYVKNNGEWSAAIPGTGGSAFVAKESRGLYTSDEAFKMSLTDALSVAMKMLGVGAVIYSAGNDYSKYTTPKEKKDSTVFVTKEQILTKIKEVQNGPALVKLTAKIKPDCERDLSLDEYEVVSQAIKARQHDFRT